LPISLYSLKNYLAYEHFTHYLQPKLRQQRINVLVTRVCVNDINEAQLKFI